jgi:hypothetical protein
MMVVFWKPFFPFFRTKYKALTNNLEILVQVKVFFYHRKKRITNYVGWYAQSV